MSIQGDGKLYIYLLNVGQADTSIIITPHGQVMILDIVKPAKVIDLLSKLQLNLGGEIEQLIITHPHIDHFRGASSLLKKYQVKSISLAPFWNQFGLGPPTYRSMLNEMYQQDANIDFISGYSRIYPDGALNPELTGGYIIDNEAPYIELLGPSNSLLSQLERDNKLDTNHLSIISGIQWKNFTMIFAADAQMENWSHFDREGMFNNKCKILRSAHHGSCNGTQWERLDRLDPRCVIISSKPDSTHGLPDLIGTSIFRKFESKSTSKIVALTSDTKSIRITVKNNGASKFEHFEDEYDKNIDLSKNNNLTWNTNATDWQTLLENRMNSIH